LYFKDYLIANNDVANEYGRLKIDLQSKYECDRDEYTNAKTEFILKHTVFARNEFKDKYNPIIQSNHGNSTQ